MINSQTLTNLSNVLCFLWIFSLSGCGDPFYSTYTTTKPNLADITGTWRIDLYKSRMPTEDNSFAPLKIGPEIKDAKLILHEDGSFDAIGLPAQLFYISDGSGEWKIKKYTKPHEFWTAELIQYRANAKYSDILFIRNPAPEYLLHKMVGDPDTGKAVVFSRDIP